MNAQNEEIVNLDDPGVKVVDLSVEDAQAIVKNYTDPKEFLTAVDIAQGEVDAGERDVAYVVLRITSD